jgi:integrase
MSWPGLMGSGSQSLRLGFDHEQVAVFVWRADRAGVTRRRRSRGGRYRWRVGVWRRCGSIGYGRRRTGSRRGRCGRITTLFSRRPSGTPLDDHNVRRQFRVITEAAGLGRTWVPRELRHTFVSLLSAHGMPVEAIALLAGHNQTATTELVYRHQIVPALTRGAEVVDQIFG